MKCLFVTDFFLVRLIISKPVCLVVDTFLEVVDTFSEVVCGVCELQERSATHSRLLSTTHSAASVSLSMFSTDRLYINRNFGGCVRVDTQFMETDEEIQGYLQLKTQSARRGKYLT